MIKNYPIAIGFKTAWRNLVKNKDKERFSELLQVYLSGKATSIGYNELMQMIKHGKYDDLLKKRIDESFVHDGSGINLDVNRAEYLLYRIVNSEKGRPHLP